MECVPLLLFLDPKQRADLVDMVLNPKGYSPLGWSNELPTFVSGMAQGLADLDAPSKLKLVEMVTSFNKGGDVAQAMCGFGRKLEHLDEALRNKLVAKAISLEEEEDRARAIADLGPGLACLKPDQQQDLLTTALGIRNENVRGGAILSLCAGLKDLGATQREILFDEVNKLPIGWRIRSIGELGKSLGSLSNPHQKHFVVTFLLKVKLDLTEKDHLSFQLYANEGLAGAVGLMEPSQRDKLVPLLIAHPDDFINGHAIAALGANLEHLTTEQQDKLIEAADNLGHVSGKATAVAGLATEVASLNPGQINRVVGMALSLPEDVHKAEAIAALGARLDQLTPDQHKVLVAAAIKILQARTTSPATARVLTAGLGARLGSLHPDLRSDLVGIVTREQQVDRAAQAIAGMGAGILWLDKSQRRELYAAANRLESQNRLMPFDEPKNVAIRGLAAEAAKARAA